MLKVSSKCIEKRLAPSVYLLLLKVCASMHVACAKICRLGFVYIKVWSLWHSNVVSLNLERERGKKKLKQLDEKTVNKATKQGCRVCFLTLLSLSKSAHAVNLINPSKINGREQDAKL